MLLVIAAIAFIGFLVYLRYVSRRHVAALFRSTVHKLTQDGADIDRAVKEAIDRLRRRAPFSQIKEEELSFFVGVLRDLNSPVEVGAEILQKCEVKRNASIIKEQQGILRTAYTEDLKLSLRKLIESAKNLQGKTSNKFPNITIALLACLSQREGWTFQEEQSEAILFKYHQKEVRIPRQGSGRDAARIVLLEEMVQRPLAAKSGAGYETRRLARQDLTEKFDSLFDEVFQDVAEWR